MHHLALAITILITGLSAHSEVFEPGDVCYSIDVDPQISSLYSLVPLGIGPDGTYWLGSGDYGFLIAVNPLTGRPIVTDSADHWFMGTGLDRVYSGSVSETGVATIDGFNIFHESGNSYQTIEVQLPNPSATLHEIHDALDKECVRPFPGDPFYCSRDADHDRVLNGADRCADSKRFSRDGSHIVDSDGCNQEQFCAQFDVTTRDGRRACIRADWQNDEPVMRRNERDCRVQRNLGCLPSEPN